MSCDEGERGEEGGETSSDCLIICGNYSSETTKNYGM